MKEHGTEQYYDEQAAICRAQYRKDGEAQRERAVARYQRGEKGHAIWLKRIPPWIDEIEIQAMRAFYKDRPQGKVVDHIVPLGHALIAGLHVLANLQYLPPRDNIKRGHRIEYTMEEAAALVAQGLAVWRRDVDGINGAIDWAKYPQADN